MYSVIYLESAATVFAGYWEQRWLKCDVLAVFGERCYHFRAKRDTAVAKMNSRGGEISVKISYGMENATDEEGGKSALFHYISRMGSCFSRIIFVYLDV